MYSSACLFRLNKSFNMFVTDSGLFRVSVTYSYDCSFTSVVCKFSLMCVLYVVTSMGSYSFFEYAPGDGFCMSFCKKS